MKKIPTPISDKAQSDGWSGDAFAVAPEVAQRLERQLTLYKKRYLWLRARLLPSEFRDMLGSSGDDKGFKQKTVYNREFDRQLDEALGFRKRKG